MIDFLIGTTAGISASAAFGSYAIHRAWITLGSTPLAIRPRRSKCVHCGARHPNMSTEVAMTIATMTAGIEVGLLEDHPGIVPAAAVLLVPEPAGHGVASAVIAHPDAFPDAADLAYRLDKVAATIHREQGQLNADGHRARRDGGAA